MVCGSGLAGGGTPSYPCPALSYDTRWAVQATLSVGQAEAVASSPLALWWSWETLELAQGWGG